METDKALGIQKPYRFLRAMFGEVLFLAPHPVYLEHRVVVAEAFRREKMLYYGDVMQEVVQRWLDGLGQAGKFELVREITTLVQEGGGRQLLPGRRSSPPLGPRVLEPLQRPGRRVGSAAAARPAAAQVHPPRPGQGAPAGHPRPGDRRAPRQPGALADYQAVERLAGADWPAIKADLLDQMARSYSYHKVDIYLYEHMLQEAMAIVDGPYWGGDLNKVIQATRAEFPDWGIGKCRRQAESIMNAGKAKDYDDAVGWLRIAHDIYRQHDRGAEWRAYLNGLLETHGRKYKLVPMLRGIG